MKKLIFMIIPILLIGFNSCKKEKDIYGCTNSTALNYSNTANKDDGSCIYPTADPCAGVTCLNGGYCSSGDCVCPTGFTGSNCSQQITPTSIKITKIVVTSFPPTTTGGGGWDLTSGADIYPELLLGSTSVWESPTYYEDANTSLDYEFIPSPQINITNIGAQYTIGLYDYDGTSSEYMGGYYFYIYNSTSGFPTTKVITNTGSSLSFTLHLTYSW